MDPNRANVHACRFEGSTLQVMGANDDEEENDWAVVGGTGEFEMARGIISRRVYRTTTTSLTQELTIEFFCRMKVISGHIHSICIMHPQYRQDLITLQCICDKMLYHDA
jgi:hypothetical protein